MSFEFSSLVPSTGALYSPSSEYIATFSNTSRVLVRKASTLETVCTFVCVDKVHSVQWSPDSTLLLCAMYSRAAVQIFSVHDAEWKCRINEGVAGLISAAWMPDSRGILTESDFGVQLGLWSLTDGSGSCSLILGQKFLPGAAPAKVYAFSTCGRFLSVIHRAELQDSIGVYSLNQPIEELVRFKARSNDVSSVRWTENANQIITIDSPLSYRVTIYTATGQVIACIEAYENAMGVRSFALPRLPAPAHFAAVGSYDSKVRLLSLQSWRVAFVLPLSDPGDLSSALLAPPPSIATSEDGGDSGIQQGAYCTVEGITDSGLPSFELKLLKTLPRATAQTTNSHKLQKERPPESSSGVSWVAFSTDGTVLACREDSRPRCVWLWDVATSRLLTVLVFQDAVTGAAWRPRIPSEIGSEQMLAVVTGSSRFYLWGPSTGASFVSFPGELSVLQGNTLTWSEDGLQLMLGNKEAFCTASIM